MAVHADASESHAWRHTLYDGSPGALPRHGRKEGVCHGSETRITGFGVLFSHHGVTVRVGRVCRRWRARQKFRRRRQDKRDWGHDGQRTQGSALVSIDDKV